jgi:hypothetical protein
VRGAAILDDCLINHVKSVSAGGGAGPCDVARFLHFLLQLFLPGVSWFGRDGAKAGVLGSLWGIRGRIPPFYYYGDSSQVVAGLNSEENQNAKW